MKISGTILKYAPAFLGLFLVFSSYRFDFHDIAKQNNLPSVEISLDSIKPGSISLAQINSLKKLIVKADGRVCLAKSYDIGIAPKSGPAHLIKWSGINLPESALFWMKKSQPGDMIIIGNLVINGIDKYQVVKDPTWTVIKEN